MSDFINGYVEWRGRDTLLKSQYGILDKDSGEHLVPVVHPENYFDPNDMDIVDSLPNQPPVYPTETVVLKPKITFGTFVPVEDSDVTGTNIDVKINGNIKTFNDTEVKTAYAVFNGENKKVITVDTDTGEFEETITVARADWQARNLVTVFANAADGAIEGPYASRAVIIADTLTATVPTINVLQVLNMPFDSTIEYELTPLRARVDISGEAVTTQRGDDIKSVTVKDSTTNAVYKAVLTNHVNAEGFSFVSWTVSIPSTKVGASSSFTASAVAGRFADSAPVNSDAIVIERTA